MKKYFYLVLILVLSQNYSASAQVKLTITSDSLRYSYGQLIRLRVELLNDTDSTIGVFSCPGGCFIFDDFDIGKHIGCVGLPPFPLYPGRSMIWKWKLDPTLLGIPNKDGLHTVVGYYETYGIPSRFSDTIFINAPRYYGGVIWVSYLKSLEDTVKILMDSLNATVINRIDNFDRFSERWKIKGYSIDSIISKYKNDSRFNYIESYITIGLDTILTSVENIPAGKVIKDFEISEAYPNPFNSTTNFYITVNRTQNISVDILNMLGQRVKTIFNGMVLEYQKKYFSIDLDNSSAGIYFIQVKGLNNLQSKKIFLLK